MPNEPVKSDPFADGARAFFSGADLTEASASMRAAVNARLQDSQKLGFTEPERHRGSPEFKIFDEWKAGWDYAKKWKQMYDLMQQADFAGMTIKDLECGKTKKGKKR